MLASRPVPGPAGVGPSLPHDPGAGVHGHLHAGTWPLQSRMSRRQRPTPRCRRACPVSADYAHACSRGGFTLTIHYCTCHCYVTMPRPFLVGYGAVCLSSTTDCANPCRLGCENTGRVRGWPRAGAQHRGQAWAGPQKHVHARSCCCAWSCGPSAQGLKLIIINPRATALPFPFSHLLPPPLVPGRHQHPAHAFGAHR